MNDVKIFCLCLNEKLINQVNNLGYTPVGLGRSNFDEKWMSDNTGDNISHKNSYYGEYTFHYWLWKNYLEQIEDNKWTGFCTYRRFWRSELTNPSNFKDSVLSRVPDKWSSYETILAEKIDLTKIKWIKVLKYGKKAFLNNPKSIFKKYRNIKFQFELNHGVGSIDKAIDLLEEKDRESFRKFINENTSFNQCNLFICKSKKILKEYYETIFSWLSKCENLFGFDLEGYNQIRIYGFLAERFMPYWFKKNSNTLEWPIIFDDLNSKIVV